MGMAASQARFLGLTGRKSNTEYQGQQVNQQRSSLANESAGLFNQMTALKVPTPPSSIDYYSSRYQFEDAAQNKFSISKIATGTTQPDGTYTTRADVEYQNKYNVGTKKDDLAGLTIAANGATGNDNITIPGVNNGNAIEIKPMGANDNQDVVESIKKQRSDLAADEKFYTISLSLTDVRIITDTDLKAAKLDPSDANYKALTSYQKTEKSETSRYTAEVTLRADSNSGRYETMTITGFENEDSLPSELAALVGNQQSLSIGKVNDNDGYELAMKEYEFQKMLYDRAIDDINNRTEVIQQQDKGLELKLKQLDTEQKAIQTEMEAVQKVIQKNVETTFKTFG